jgi:hypothetical protein
MSTASRLVARAATAVAATVLVAAVLATESAAQWYGSAAIETRAFPESGLFDSQSRLGFSLALRPMYDRAWDRGSQQFTFEGFVRLDQHDGNRTHADFRVLSWEKAWDYWELRVGFRTVFWGVTESNHLVDIINQTDLVEDPDGEQKLGQPMVNLAWIQDFGTIEAFLMPLFRERTFPGSGGRLRFPLSVDTDATTFGRGAGRATLDWALRWSHYFGPLDVGLSHFNGVSREPLLFLVPGEGGQPVLAPHYGRIHQTGLDVQATLGGWLLKLETIRRTGQGTPFVALTGGFEYTVVGALGTSSDVGLLAEYLYDERGEAAPFQNDVFLGTRVALNDVQSTSVLAGVILDPASGASLFRAEASRRLGDDWTLDVRAAFFTGLGPTEPLYGFRRDGYLQFELARHF